jgi:hypothetical protein
MEKKEMMKDGKGRLVPIALVKPIDRQRDMLVKLIVEGAQKQSASLAVFKKEAMEAIDAFVEKSAAQHGVHLGGKRGNVSLLSFDGEYKVQLSIADRVTFDEKLLVAKKLIDQCIHSWSKGSKPELEVLINHAFEVDKAGKVNTDRILGLRRLNIKDERWKKAMDVIGESVQITESKEYIRIYKRSGKDSYSQVNLDVASL